MRLTLCFAAVLCCTQLLSGQDIPGNVLVLKDGGFVHGRISDSTSQVTRIYLYSRSYIQLSTREIAGEYKLPARFREEIKANLVSPVGAGALSFLCNGAGHFYVGEYTEAVLHFALQAGALGILVAGLNAQNSDVEYLGGALLGLLKLLAISDAVSAATSINQLRINRAIVDHINKRNGPSLELSYDIVPINNGAAAGLQVRF